MTNKQRVKHKKERSKKRYKRNSEKRLRQVLISAHNMSSSVVGELSLKELEAVLVAVRRMKPRGSVNYVIQSDFRHNPHIANVLIKGGVV